MENQLKHHGIKGQKWGVRRFQNKDGTLTKLGKNRLGVGEKEAEKRGSKGRDKESKKKHEKEETKAPSKKSVSEMSDSELREAVSRLELERRYSDLSKPENKAKISRGKAFVMDVLESSAKNIAKQAVTNALGTALNKIVGSEVVNPKKGQKDK